MRHCNGMGITGELAEGIENAIVVTTYPNPDIRVYNIRYQLSESTEFNLSKKEIKSSTSITPLGKAIARELLNVRGITSVSFDNIYSVRVAKGKAFSFEELEPKIFDLINANLIIASDKHE